MDAQSVLDDGFAGVPPSFDGRAELQKPPLYYWLAALAASRARPWTPGRAAAGGAGGAWRRAAAVRTRRGAAAGRRLRGGGRPGHGAALHLAGAFGRTDMPLTLTTAAALLAFYRASERPARSDPIYRVENSEDRMNAVTTSRGAAPAVVHAGSWLPSPSPRGCCSRGPSAPCCPLGVAAAWLLVNRDLPLPWCVRDWLRLLDRYGLWWGVPLAALLVVPVYLWANARTGGDFFRVFLWHHNVERGFGGSEVLRPTPGGSTCAALRRRLFAVESAAAGGRLGVRPPRLVRRCPRRASGWSGC